MNRLRVLKQRATRAQIGIMRHLDDPLFWDVIDSCGPRGLRLSRRSAINFAGAIASRGRPNIKAYLTDSKGQWHRGDCVEVANRHTIAPKPCDCSRLVV